MSTNYQQSFPHRDSSFQPQRSWNSQSTRNVPPRSYNSYQRPHNVSNSSFDSRRNHASSHHQAHLADTDETVDQDIDKEFHDTFHTE